MQLSKETLGFSNRLMDFSQADSAAETTSCPFLSFHYIYDLFINKTRKKYCKPNFASYQFLWKPEQNAQPTRFHIQKSITVCCISAEICSRSATDNFLWTSYSHVPVCAAKPNPVTKQAQWREQHRRNSLTFPVITKGSSTLTMPHNSSKTPLPKALSW